jgi:hypothetical protein
MKALVFNAIGREFDYEDVEIVPRTTRSGLPTTRNMVFTPE